MSKVKLGDYDVVNNNYDYILLARENGFFFFQTSAKQGTGITDLIESLGNEYLKRNGCVERSTFILQKAKTLPRKKKDKCC